MGFPGGCEGVWRPTATIPLRASSNEVPMDSRYCLRHHIAYLIAFGHKEVLAKEQRIVGGDGNRFPGAGVYDRGHCRSREQIRFSVKICFETFVSWSSKD